MVDKNRVVYRKDASAHLILWISSDLSTDRSARSADFLSFRFARLSKSSRKRSINVLGIPKNYFWAKFLTSIGLCVFCIAGEAARLSFLLFVYLKGMYTSIVVIVNTGTFLWISQYFLLQSSVYGFYKPVGCSVSGWYQFWTKIGLWIKLGLSTNRTCGYT